MVDKNAELTIENSDTKKQVQELFKVPNEIAINSINLIQLLIIWKAALVFLPSGFKSQVNQFKAIVDDLVPPVQLNPLINNRWFNYGESLDLICINLNWIAVNWSYWCGFNWIVMKYR